MSKNILVTGAAGYLGSHTCTLLLESGYKVTALDDLSNSSSEAIRRVEKLTGKSIRFIKGSVLNPELLHHVFNGDEGPIDAVIHFAGLKSVADSVSTPLSYYHTNVAGTVTLCEMMQQAKVRKLIFSSSACVYGDTPEQPVREDMPTQKPSSPYGRTKLMAEEILEDLYRSDNSWNIAVLRYFNPVGAHPGGMIGENPKDTPNNLMPFITQVAIGQQRELKIFGDDYPTPDGTGVRDYIHVMDLVEGHLKALEWLNKKKGLKAFNLGTGHGHSVLELVKAFEQASGRKIPYKITKRRPGDIATSYADPSLAKKELGWTAKRSINDMCKDAWNWQSKNPNGYNK